MKISTRARRRVDIIGPDKRFYRLTLHPDGLRVRAKYARRENRIPCDELLDFALGQSFLPLVTDNPPRKRGSLQDNLDQAAAAVSAAWSDCPPEKRPSLHNLLSTLIASLT